jgi:hypothetical protein
MSTSVSLLSKLSCCGSGIQYEEQITNAEENHSKFLNSALLFEVPGLLLRLICQLFK